LLAREAELQDSWLLDIGKEGRGGKTAGALGKLPYSLYPKLSKNHH
jgi:hypothetical protein